MAIQNGGPGAGTWFKPSEFATAKAFYVEGKRYQENVESMYGPRNVATVDIAVFRSVDELDGKAEPTVLTNVNIDKAALVRPFGEDPKAEMVAALIHVPARPPKSAYFAWGQVDDAVFERVVAWVEKRNEAIDGTDLPDF